MNSQHNDHDIEWIMEYKQCHQDALTRLIKKYYIYIYKSFIYRGIPRIDAEDCTQDICLRLVRSLKNFEFRSTFKTFLDRAINNRWIDFISSRSRNVVLISLYFKLLGEDSEIELIDILRNGESDDPEQNYKYQLLIRTLKKCLEQIKHPRQKKLVALWLDGHKRKYMADLLCIPIGSVHGDLERGKTRLRNCIKKNYC
jgi:RNA polymerase sigma factor (sigma-70 family)